MSISTKQKGILNTMLPSAQAVSLGDLLNEAGGVSMGTIHYVNGLASVTGDGASWDTAFLTMTEAVAAAVDYDIIIVGAGYYSEAAVMDITQHGLKIIGTGNGGQWGPCGFGSAVSGDTIMTINANRVELSGIAFWCLTNAKQGVVLGTSYDSWNTWIHDCAFGTGVGGNTLGEYGIKANETEDCANTLIEDCYFHYMSTAAIVSKATRMTIRRNLIWSSSIGIDIQNEADAFANCAVYDNHIIGRGSETSGDIGIKLASTEPTDGTVYVGNNVVTSFSTNITQDKGDAGLVNNGTSGNGSSPLIVDAQN